jgi:hypothetical protein
MMPQGELEALSRLFQSDSKLIELCSEPPQVMLMPFQHSDSEVFLSIAIPLPVESLSLTTIWQASRLALEASLQTALASHWRALELLFFSISGTESERFLRITLYEEAFGDPYLDLPSDVLRRNPKQGITCGWYWDSTKLATIQ